MRRDALEKLIRWNLNAGLLALGATILMALLTALLLAVPWVLFPLRSTEEIRYPERVTFTRTPADYSRAIWDADDWDIPAPCPLTIRLDGVDLDPIYLGSLDRLQRLGWTERVYWNSDGQVTGKSMTSPRGVVSCTYRGGRLTNVTVDSAKATPPGDVAVGIGGRWVGLPNSSEMITTTLGAPLPK